MDKRRYEWIGLNGWKEGLMDERRDEWMEGRMNGCKEG